MRITNQNPHQPPQVTLKDLKVGEAFIFDLKEPALYILFDNRSLGPAGVDDGPEGWCVELAPSKEFPDIRSFSLSKRVHRVRLVRMDIEMLPKQGGES